MTFVMNRTAIDLSVFAGISGVRGAFADQRLQQNTSHTDRHNKACVSGQCNSRIPKRAAIIGAVCTTCHIFQRKKNAFGAPVWGAFFFFCSSPFFSLHRAGSPPLNVAERHFCVAPNVCDPENTLCLCPRRFFLLFFLLWLLPGSLSGLASRNAPRSVFFEDNSPSTTPSNRPHERARCIYESNPNWELKRASF
ncbi:hypothetical protein BSAF29S_02819 [Bacillus safensis subsp. safensis]